MGFRALGEQFLVVPARTGNWVRFFVYRGFGQWDAGLGSFFHFGYGSRRRTKGTASQFPFGEALILKWIIEAEMGGSPPF